MSTRATIRFAERKSGQSFGQLPKEHYAQFYKHHDGYPEGLGIDIAKSLIENQKLSGWELEHIDMVHADVEYLYYIWQKPNDDNRAVYISIFEKVYGHMCELCYHERPSSWECIFVGDARNLIDKYKDE